MKKIISLCLCLLMLISNPYMMVSAEENATTETTIDTEVCVNPLYESEIDEQIVETELYEAKQYGAAAYADTVYSSIDSAAEYLRGEMVSRNNTISLKVNRSVSSDFSSLVKSIVNKALEYRDTSTGQEADALKYGWTGYSASGSVSSSLYSITLTVSYYTTNEQEKQLTTAVNNALAGLHLSGATEIQKVKAIHDYILQNVTYDNDNLNDSTYTIKYSAYAALVNKAAVCQGYAVLFYRMCKDAGLAVRVVSGHATAGSHAWNIVKIGSKYYNVDTTWDDSTNSSDYYLKSELAFRDHFRDSEFVTEDFITKFPVAENSYGVVDSEKLNVNNQVYTFSTIDNKSVSTTANGKAKVLIYYKTTCPNSRSSIKSINQSPSIYSEANLLALEANKTDAQGVQDFINTYGGDKMQYAYATDNYISSLMWKYYGLAGGNASSITFPCMIFIDKNDKIQGFTSGLLDNQQFAYYLKLFTNITATVLKPLNSINMNKENLALNKGESSNLSVTYNPSDTTDNKTVTWSVGNTNVATVDSTGKVTAIGKGSTTIIAKVGDKSATCVVNVKEKSYIYNGIDYTPIFDAQYYLNRYSDIKQAFGDDENKAFTHFRNNGIKEGRQGNNQFEVYSYKGRYVDLQRSYGSDLQKYYQHYINNGIKEGRDGSPITTTYIVTFVSEGNVISTQKVMYGHGGSTPTVLRSGATFKGWDKSYTCITCNQTITAVWAYIYKGIDYSPIFDAEYYLAKYADLQRNFGSDGGKALEHFVNNGMKEGRQGKECFDVYSYKARYVDLQRAYGKDMKRYYLHYLNNGIREGRSGTPLKYMYNGVDYSAVFDAYYYLNHYEDLKKAFGADEQKAFSHFIKNGMKEGRQGSIEFNLSYYRNHYEDLRKAFGTDSQLYYKHYVTNGKNEGRKAA